MMKRFIICNILLLLYTICFAQMYETTSAPLRTRQIGYTTNYGYSFNQSSCGVTPIHANNITFRSVNNHTYSNFRYTNTYMPISTYRGSTSSYGNRPGGGPRKSAQRPFSGNFLEDLADWWRIYTDSDWPGYVDEDYWDEFLAAYPEYEDEAREWYENQGMHFPGDPDDPFMEPIGEFPIALLLLLIFGYVYYRKRKTVSV